MRTTRLPSPLRPVPGGPHAANLAWIAGAMAAVFPFSSFGAPCCGALSATPTMITGDDSAQLSVSFAQSEVVGDAFATGLPVFRAEGDDELSRTLRLEGAFLVSDRWQVGASLPLTQRSRSTPKLEASSTGIGDIGINAAYEALPEWVYSAWKPRGFAFAQVLLPTGGSVHDAATEGAPLALDARGRGFYSLGAGAVFIKAWSSWDAVAMAEAHHAFPRTFGAGTPEALKVTPGWGASAALGSGYSLASLPLRIGASVSPAYEQGLRSESAAQNGPSTSEPQLVWNTSAQIGWAVTRSASLNAIYTDQTLLGPANNVSLNRTLALTFQQRWER